MKRFRAGLVYTTDPKGIKIIELSQLEEFKDVPYTTLVDWCQRDNWNERRTEIYESWRNQAVKAIGDELVQERRDSLNDIRKIRQIAMTQLMSNAVEAKSWEGLAKIFLSLDERLHTVSKEIGQSFIPEAVLESGEPEDKSDLTDEEIEAAVQAVLQKRLTATSTH